MRYVTLDKIKLGDELATEVYDTAGRVMLMRGAVLTKNYIERLDLLGYSGVYIADSVSSDIEIAPPISYQLRMAAMECVKNLDVEQTVTTAAAIIEELLCKQIVSLDMESVHSFDDCTYAHSVNVAVLCCVIGIGMGLPEQDLSDLVNAALLHDFGKMRIPDSILNKRERLTGEEYDLMKTHVNESYEIIKNKTCINDNIKECVRCHHENEDGSGYPDGLEGDQIPLIAKILHVADVYDALVSDRPYKKGYARWEAVEYLMGGCGISFSRQVVKNFIKIVPLYSVGTEIQLSNGENCIVINNSGLNNLRPIVRRVRDLRKIDLSERENLNLTIHSADDRALEANEASRQAMIDESGKRKIAVVDDMKTNLQMLREILAKDYNLVLLKSGKQLLSYLEKNLMPDMIIMDIDMPGMNGIETVKKVREEYSAVVPVLFVTALSDRETVMACRRLNASGYIIRPYQPVYVLSEIRRIIDGLEEY